MMTFNNEDERKKKIIDIQWFADDDDEAEGNDEGEAELEDDDDGLEGEEGEEGEDGAGEAVEREVFEDMLSETDDVYEVSSEPVNDKRAQLIAKLKRDQAELLKKNNTNDVIAAGLAKLAGGTAPKKTADPRITPPANTDWAKYKDTFNEKIFEDPFTQIADLIGKAQEMDAGATGNMNITYARKIAEMDPSSANVMKRWGEEVDAEVAAMPAAQRAKDADIYAKAVKIVKANHLDELIEEKVAEAAKKNSQTAGKKPPKSFAEGGRTVADVGKGTKKKKISAETAEKVRQYAELYDVPESAAFGLMKRKHLIK